MKKVLIIGSGLSGMSCAVTCAGAGLSVTLVSPFPSERAQSVMAAGGINAALDSLGEGDSIQAHIEDTLRGGHYIAGKEAVKGLCETAPEIVGWLEGLGTVFTPGENGHPAQRAFGGQSFRRTCYCGASTGKQLVSALVMEVRRYEALGLIKRQLWTDFHSALIDGGKCWGALLYNEATGALEPQFADFTVIATGGQNALFGKTTGSSLCDGYAAGRLFMQGAELKNLEFIQYHPTSIETSQKRMLISEAARGEGGRLYYEENGRRVYFMEELYGPRGNLMPRDVVSREISRLDRQVYLDITFLGRDVIEHRLSEIRDLCLKYLRLDPVNESIPVGPTVHFFMGGLAVHLNHETNIRDLYAVGECTSMYHGANRLGGNSLLAAIYSGRTAGADMAGKAGGSLAQSKPEKADMAGKASAPGPCANDSQAPLAAPDFSEFIENERRNLEKLSSPGSSFPVSTIRSMLAKNMHDELGILRNEQDLRRGIDDISFLLSAAEKIRFDRSVLTYFNYSITGILNLAKATLTCADFRKESRGAHQRSDYPQEDKEWEYATIISYDGGNFRTRLDREHEYES